MLHSSRAMRGHRRVRQRVRATSLERSCARSAPTTMQSMAPCARRLRVDHRERSPRARSCARASQRDGPITFRDFMEAALYHPKYGYYTTSAGVDEPRRRLRHEPGGASDLRRARREADLPSSGTLCRVRPRFDVVEQGGGSGLLARDILRWAHAHEPAFAARAALHASSRSARRCASAQRRTLAAADLPDGAVEWLDALPSRHRRAACCRTSCSTRSRCIASCAQAANCARSTSRSTRRALRRRAAAALRSGASRGTSTISVCCRAKAATPR